MEPERDPDPAPDPDPDPDPDPHPEPRTRPHMETVSGSGPVPVTGPVTIPDPVTDPDVQPLPRGGFRCRLCQITAANRPSLASHLSGKRHRRLRALRAERREQELRSLFVSGFARGTDPAELRRLFGAFGTVTAVVMDKDRGAFAIVELAEQSARQRALAQPRHSLGGRRLRVRPREHKNFPRPPRGPPEPPQTRGLQQALGQAQDVEAQLVLLVQLLELSEAERRLRDLLVSLFQEVFSEFFPGCSIVPFGSSVNGFDVHGCDLDLHLELPAEGDPPQDPPPTLRGDKDPPKDPQPGGTLTGNDDPPPREALMGDVSPHTNGSLLGSEGRPPKESLLGSQRSILESEGSLLGSEEHPPEQSLLGSPVEDRGSPLGSEGSLLEDGPPPCSEGSLSDDEGAVLGVPPGGLLALVGSVLRRCVPGVQGVRPVPGARRPVVKFSHKQSGLRGDVCVNNRLALFNTRFLRFCADADPRVRPLGYAVRAWARARGLAGNPSGGGPLLTNYALTLLVVFFLQTRSPPVLPSVLQLRELAGPEDRAEVGGWDCSFPRDPSVLEPSENTQSTGSLLAEFFSFFGGLELGRLLLSPLEGRALPRPPPGPPGGLRPGPLTLQDPFELSHNVAANVPPRAVRRFSRCCRDAAKFCRGPEFRHRSRRGRPWGLLGLLQPGGTPEKDLEGFVIPIPLRPQGCSPLSGGFREVCEAVGFVLGDVLGCRCHPGGDTGTPQDGEELALHPWDTEEPPLGSERRLEGEVGDSRGEFGVLEDTGAAEEGTLDPGDVEEPPLGSRCGFEGVTGHSQREFGVLEDTGTPEEGPVDLSGSKPAAPGSGNGLGGEVGGDSQGELGLQGGLSLPPAPGSKRRLPEGPNSPGIPPGKRPRPPPSPPSLWSCSVWHRVWRGRRRLRRRLRDPRGGNGGGPEGGPGGIEAPGGALEGLGGHPEGPGGDPGGSNKEGHEVEGPREVLGGPVRGPGEGPGGSLGDPGGDSGGGLGEALGDPRGTLDGHGAGPEGGSGGDSGGGPGWALRDPGGDSGGALGGPGQDPLALERAVTEAIVGGDIVDPPGDPHGDPPGPLLRFQVRAGPGGSRRDPQVLLQLQPHPDPPPPLFHEFFHFLRSFLPEMVRQRLGTEGGDRRGVCTA